MDESPTMTSSPANGGDIEKQQIGLSTGTPEEHSTHHHHHHHGAHLRERLRHFLHPNGKKIHVAASPEEAISLKARLSQIHSDDDFEIYISGTPEHLDALRSAQNHHEDRRDQLRQEHPEMFERFSKVQDELDALAMELDRVTTVSGLRAGRAEQENSLT